MRKGISSRICLVSSIALSCFLFSRLVSTAAEPPKFDADKLAAIHAGMQKFVDDHQICGAVLVVGTSKGIVYHDAVGNQRLDSAHPMPKDAIFRIMSMTKPITAMGIMLLVEEGKLSLDDPVEKHLPEFKGQMMIDSKTDTTLTLKKPSRPLTVRDLLTHTGGEPENPPGLTDLMRKRNRTLAEVVGIDSQRPLDFEPGSKWKYSSSGMDTLGRIIEVLSGKSYEQFLDERIIQPLGMRDTAFYLTRAAARSPGRTLQRSRWQTRLRRRDGRGADRETQISQPGRRTVFHRRRSGEALFLACSPNSTANRRCREFCRMNRSKP